MQNERSRDRFATESLNCCIQGDALIEQGFEPTSEHSSCETTQVPVSGVEARLKLLDTGRHFGTYIE